MANPLGWDILLLKYPCGILEGHVIPRNDDKEHTTDRDDFGCICWCKPKHEDSLTTKLVCEVVHNSADGREKFEENPCLLN